MAKEIKFSTHFEPNKNIYRFTNLLGQPKHLIDNVNRLNFVVSDTGLQVIKSRAADYFLDGMQDLSGQKFYGDFPGLESKNRLEFLGGNFYEKENQNNQITLESLIMNTVLVNVKLSNNIKKTTFRDRKGTFKEFINQNNYEVEITGMITNSELTNVYPEQEVLRLIQFCELHSSFGVFNDYLTNFGIDELYINDYKLSQRRGNENTQNFTINATSILKDYYLKKLPNWEEKAINRRDALDFDVESTKNIV